MAGRIVQFGTSRFPQAHVDLFVHEARQAGQAVGPIAVVQVSGSPERARFLNPYLDHRVADVAQNHAVKVDRRIAGFLAWISGTGRPPAAPTLEGIVPRNRGRLRGVNLARLAKRSSGQPA